MKRRQPSSKVKLNAHRVWELHNRLNMTQNELARLVGTSSGYLSNSCPGHAAPRRICASGSTPSRMPPASPGTFWPHAWAWTPPPASALAERYEAQRVRAESPHHAGGAHPRRRLHALWGARHPARWGVSASSGGRVRPVRGRQGGLGDGSAAAGLPAHRVRLSPGLPCPAGAVQGGKRAELEGDCQAARRQPPPAQAVAEQGRGPQPGNLFLLLTIAGAMGLRDGILMCPDRDLPEGLDLEGHGP